MKQKRQKIKITAKLACYSAAKESFATNAASGAHEKGNRMGQKRGTKDADLIKPILHCQKVSENLLLPEIHRVLANLSKSAEAFSS